jgi:hypothetical protein
MKKCGGLTVTLIALTLMLSFQSLAQQRGLGERRSPGPPPPTQSKNKLQELANRAGGHFVLRYQPSATVYPNLEELGKRSDLVVVGRTLSHRTKLTDDGNFINQEFLVRVQEVLKGDAPGRSLVMTVPGGAYRFEDGTYAVVEPLGLQPPVDQNLYVFFLKNAEGEGRGITLASETQGFFDLSERGSKASSLANGNPMARKYGDMSAADFLAELHRAVPRKTNDGSKK